MKKAAANVILAVSLAVCKADAHLKDKPLHKYIMEIVGNKDKYEYPAPAFKERIISKYGQDAVKEDNDGGYTLNIQMNEALELLNTVIDEVVEEKARVVKGDHSLMINHKMLMKAIEKRICNSLYLEVNQLGWITECIEALKLSKKVS
ncbi:Enolase [Parasponia andersonii]|uniref:phosphopyruvate hydratase n=1 Tax=Parasponia andersonii TaxID=3476 RepID=A0A2P5E393_PARAD|nr:Enolase [Parasponia andersonii]